jgi:outer membrane receptor protein involved in Fe transport
VRSFDPVIGTSTATPVENRSYAFTLGNRFALGGERTIGVIGGLSYSHKFDFYEDGQNNGAAINDPEQPLTPGVIRRDTRGLDEVLAGALASVLYRAGPRHGVGLRWVKNQAAEDESRFQAAGSSSVEQNQSLHYTERVVRSWQLHGDHRWDGPGFAGLLVDWVGSFNETRQDEPDVRFFRNIFDKITLTARQPSNSTEAQNTRRIFREVSEDNLQAAFNLTLPFQRKESEGKVRFGLYWDSTDRDYGQTSFTYQFFSSQQGPLSQQNLAASRFQADDVDDLWTDVFLEPGRIGLAEPRCPPGQPASNCSPPTQFLWYIKPLATDVDYTGDQQIAAVYGMAELPLTQRLRFIGGARYETTQLEIVPINPVSGQVEVIVQAPPPPEGSGDRYLSLVPQEQTRVDIDDPKLLPSAGLVWAARPQMNVRLAATRTLARSTFRELAPVATEEFIFGDEFVGNPELTLSDISNYDMRWEWFR